MKQISSELASLPGEDGRRQDHDPEVLPARRVLDPAEGRRLGHRPPLDRRVPADRGIRPAPRPGLGQDQDERLRRHPHRRQGPEPPEGGERRPTGQPGGIRLRPEIRRVVQGAPGREAGLAQPRGAPQAEAVGRRLPQGDQGRARRARQGRLSLHRVQAGPAPAEAHQGRRHADPDGRRRREGGNRQRPRSPRRRPIPTTRTTRRISTRTPTPTTTARWTWGCGRPCGSWTTRSSSAATTNTGPATTRR